jgi:hypothetical protein
VAKGQQMLAMEMAKPKAMEMEKPKPKELE